MSHPKFVTLMGCGDVFDSIISDLTAYSIDGAYLNVIKFDDVSEIAVKAQAAIDGVDVQSHRVFMAVDEHVMNHARMELFGRAKMRGLDVMSLVHQSAYVASDVKLRSNVWIGPKACVAAGCNILSNVMLGAACRLDSSAKIGEHTWLGAGVSVGSHASIGRNSVLMADQCVKSYTCIGKYCLLDAGHRWSKPMPDGSFLESIYDEPAVMIGPGYSYSSSIAISK